MRKHGTLFCFSPPVMIATFVIEAGMALYVLWKFRHHFLARLVAMTLGLLATFQLAEWMVCQGALGMNSVEWAKLGFVAISFLPPLGIHMATVIADRPNSRLVNTGYVAAAMFSMYFLLATQGIGGSVCGGNYVIFELAPQAVSMFSAYYYAMLLLGTTLALSWARNAPDKPAASALRGLAVGYITFMAPTVAVYLVNPQLSAGIPSIMCGFAISLAFILVLWVLPKHLESDAAENKPEKSKQRIRNV